MQYFTEINNPEVSKALVRGDIGILKTDTLYGIVAVARHQGAVERVFSVRGRDRHKACIMLIADFDDLYNPPESVLQDFMEEHWPGPVSIVVPSPTAPDYLTFVDGTIAYRMPADESLRTLLRTTGPLIAPSANLQGQPPATTIEEARAYFGDTVDFYVEAGEVKNQTPSQLWTYHDNEMQRLR